MIPLLAILRFGKSNGRIFRLWVPLFLVWLLLLPLVLVSLPFAFIVLAVMKVNPFYALKTAWQVLTGLKGTHVEVHDDNDFVLIRIL